MLLWISCIVLINNIMNDFGYTFFIVLFFLSSALETRLQNHFSLVFFTGVKGKEELLTGELIKYYVAFHPETSPTKEACRDLFGLNTGA